MENKTKKLQYQLLILTAILLVSFTFSQAAQKGDHIAKEKIGQKFYINRCSACHGAGKIGGNTSSTDEWADSFAKNGAELIDLHIDEENCETVLKYLKSDDFRIEKIRMLRFLQEFAYDSEYIPTCY